MPTTIEPNSECNYATVLADRADADFSSVDRDLVLDLYRFHGALLFRGFAIDLTAFESFTSGFCSGFVLNDSRGRQLISQKGKIQTVDPGGLAFPLHPELSTSPMKPDLAWFKCVKAPPRGGETLLCDGVAVVPQLRPEVRASLAQRSLRYRKRVPPPLLKRWFGTPEPEDDRLLEASSEGFWSITREQGAYFRSYTTPALHRPMFSDSPAFGNFLLFARFGQKLSDYPTFEDGTEIPDAVALEVKRVSEALTTAHRWEPNDLLMIDNTRFMHGRNDIEDLSQRIVLSRFGYASFAPLSESERRAQPWRHMMDSDSLTSSWTFRMAVSL